MKCPGCPPSVAPLSRFCWQARPQTSTTRQQKPACISTDSLSKHEMAHLLVYESRRMRQCREADIPYENLYRIATKEEHRIPESPATPARPAFVRRACNFTPCTVPNSNSSPSEIVRSKTLRQDGPYKPIVMSHSVYVSQSAPRNGGPCGKVSYYLHPGSVKPCTQSTRVVHCLNCDPLNEVLVEPPTAPYSETNRDYSDHRALLSAHKPSPLPPEQDSASNQSSERSVSPGGSVFGTGKRRALPNPNGFDSGLVYMPGSLKTSIVSRSCRPSTSIHVSRLMAPVSSYCHFRPGLGNTYFYD